MPQDRREADAGEPDERVEEVGTFTESGAGSDLTGDDPSTERGSGFARGGEDPRGGAAQASTEETRLREHEQPRGGGGVSEEEDAPPAGDRD